MKPTIAVGLTHGYLVYETDKGYQLRKLGEKALEEKVFATLGEAMLEGERRSEPPIFESTEDYETRLPYMRPSKKTFWEWLTQKLGR
jgi:hypothetical protein